MSRVDTERTIPAESDRLPERFWAKTERREPDSCWPWRGAIGARGYGSIRCFGRSVAAHRVAWFLANSEWPRLFVCHHCDNRRCINPAHLFVGTAKDNTQDMLRKGRHRVLRGEECPRARLSREDVIEIRTRHAAGLPQAAIGKVFAISKAHVSGIVNRKRWQCL